MTSRQLKVRNSAGTTTFSITIDTDRSCLCRFDFFCGINILTLIVNDFQHWYVGVCTIIENLGLACDKNGAMSSIVIAMYLILETINNY